MDDFVLPYFHFTPGYGAKSYGTVVANARMNYIWHFSMNEFCK